MTAQVVAPTASTFRNSLYHYSGEVQRIVDGDTVRILLALGCRVYATWSIRLLGYNAPELFSGPERAAGAAARDALLAIMPPGTTVFIETQLDRENFGRLLGHVYVPEPGDTLLDVAAAMIAAGHGVRA